MCIIGAEPSITLSIKAQNPGQNRSLYLDSEPRDVKFSILAYLLWLKFEKKNLLLENSLNKLTKKKS